MTLRLDPDATTEVAVAPVHRGLRGLQRADRLWLAAVLALLVAAALVSVLRLGADHRVVLDDEATITRNAHQVLSVRPALGMVTTAGQYVDRTVWNPGPAQFWQMFPFVRLLGPDAGAWTSALVVNLGSVLLAGWAGLRARGRLAGLVTLLGTAAMLDVTMLGELSSVLNARVAVAPMVAALFLAWAVAVGDAGALVWLAVAGTFSVQAHVGTAPFVLVAWAVGAWGLARAVRSGRTVPKLRRDLWLAAGAMAVMWLQPLLDQLFGKGNLGALATTRIPGRGLHGIGQFLGAALNLPPMAFRQDPVTGLVATPDATALVTVAAVALGVWVCRRRLRSELELVVLTSAVVVAAAYTAAQVPASDQTSYHFYWVRASIWFVALAAVLVAVSPLGRDRSAQPSAVAYGLSLVAVAALVAPMAVRPELSAAERRDMDASRAIADQLRSALPPGLWQTLPRSGLAGHSVARGVMLQSVGSSRRVLPDTDMDPSADGALVITLGTPRARPGLRLVASWAPEGSEGWAESDVPARVVAFLRAHPPKSFNGGVTPHVVVEEGDGTAETLCPEQVAAHPETLVERSPTLVARLAPSTDVVLPPALMDDLVEWQLSAPVRVWRRAPVRPSARPDPSPSRELVLSRAGC